MIELDNLTVGYEARALLENISLKLESGQLVALLGRNGAGKSTLLRTIMGLEKQLGGEIRFDGESLSKLDVHQLARKVSLVTTEKIRIPDLKVRNLVAMGRSPYTDWMGRLKENDEEAVNRALRLTDMEVYAERTMDRMSDGECQRVMIARALAQDTPVILLDEPTSFLDLPNRYSLCMLLRRLVRESGKLILFSTHELDIALSVCDSIMLIDNPCLYSLSTEEMVHSGHIERLFCNDVVRFEISEWSSGNYGLKVHLPDGGEVGESS